ncbi:hypothetical protein [Roseicella frigidaeris]|uniref:hypothetical protein n=1 Tax=Roseicella frigidaeris TaxID=2230885 RepID=UPI001402F174|nr:hypothetical protein [Roseicella frigidaeris]
MPTLGVAGVAVGFGAMDMLGESFNAGRKGGTPISESLAAGIVAGVGSAAGTAGPSSRLRPKMAMLPPFRA